MASGSFISNTGTNLEIGAEWTATANTAGNYSTVKVDVFLTHYSIYCVALSGSYIKIGDIVYNFSQSINRSQNTYAKTYIASYETTVPHLNDGTKSIMISVGWNFSGVYNGTSIGMLEASRNVALDQIPRESSFSIPSTVTLGSEITVSITSHLSSHQHKLFFKVGNKEHLTGYLSGASPKVSVPGELAEGMTDRTSLAEKVTLHTYDQNGRWIGERSVQVTYKVPGTADFIPDFTFSISPYSSFPYLNEQGIYASGISKVRATVTAQRAKYGAAVKSCEISVGAVKKTGYSVISDYLASGNVTVAAKVTDTRGHSTTKSFSVNVKLYRMPYSASVSVFRCDETGNAADAGSYIHVYAAAKCSGLDGINNCNLQISYKAHSSELYTEKINVASENTMIISAGLTAENSYDVKITCTDTVGNSTDHIVLIPTAKTDLHIKNGSVRFGGFCEKTGFDCNWDANFAGKLSIGEAPIDDFVIESGKNGVFKWRKWNSGFSECYGNTENKSYVMTELWGNLYRSVAPQNSLYYPYGLFTEAPIVHALLRQDGLYGMTAVQGSSGSESNSPAFYVVSPVSSTITASIDLYCVGRWK